MAEARTVPTPLLHPGAPYVMVMMTEKLARSALILMRGKPPHGTCYPRCDDCAAFYRIANALTALTEGKPGCLTP